MNIRREQRGERVQWVLEKGYSEGKREREYFTTERAAKARRSELNRDKTAVGRYWSKLDRAKQRETVLVLMQMEGEGVSLADLWAAYQRGEVSAVSSVKMPKALAEMLLAKEAANRSARYVASLRQTLKPFTQSHANLLASEVTQAHVEKWLAGRKVGAWTRATDRQRLETLFAFCVRRKWCAENPVTNVERVSTDSGAPQILTPPQCRLLLRKCRRHTPDLLAWLVLGLFAGCRPEEADRLTEDDCDLERGRLKVSQPGKRGRQRLTPLPANAVEWLKLDVGLLPINPTTRRRRQRLLRDLVGWAKWPQDILRHTAASHLMAKLRNAHEVADMLGNSPKIIHAHYRELVTPEEVAALDRVRP